MSIIEEVKRMQKEGRQEQDLLKELNSKGFSQQDINNALSHSQIKQAVSEDEQAQFPGDIPKPTQEQGEQSPQNPQTPDQPGQAYPDMQPSMFSENSQEQPTQEYPAYEPAPSPEQFQPQYQQYPAYQPYQSVSSDTITEISEQIVSEKLSPIRDQLENALSLKTELSSKIEHIEERLKRLEKLIDTLQVSVLRKVGDSITNIEDIKNEVIETQKSFKSLLDKSNP